MIQELLQGLTSQRFMPHGMCYLWNPPLLWTHVVSDAAIGIAYVAISSTLAYLVYRIRDLPFQWVYLAFGVFIVACGGTHFMEVWTVWNADYWSSGALKVATALVSLGTAMILPTLVPKAADFARAAQVAADRGLKLDIAYRDLATLYERAKELEQAKTQFFANVSHELRTPLALILGHSDRLAGSPRLDGDDRRQIEVIARNARTLLKHVNDLLDMSKIEAGRLAIRYLHEDVSRLVRLTTANFDLLADEKRIVFDVRVPDVLVADVDPHAFQKLLINLLGNAFKFTPGGGQIRCEVVQAGASDPDGGSLILTVADSGPGVPAELRDVIFERFRQLEESSTRRFGGTGLGLAIVKDLVRLHHGDIRVGHAPEGGALFEVRLPSKAPAGAVVDTTSESSPIDNDAVDHAVAALREYVDATTVRTEVRRGVVLVAEDNVDMNRFVAESLAEDGYDVHRAFDGEEALQKARSVPPDVIVTDIMMPGMSGDEVVRESRRDPVLANVPIIVLTARADDVLRVRLLREGAQDYLVKPFGTEELKARVANQMAIKRARDILQRAIDRQIHDLSELAAEVTTRKQELQSALEAMRVARDHAERASHTKSEFLGLVSHEFRTPLTTLTLQLRLLAREPGELTPRQRELIDRMRASSKRALDLIEMLLEYARIQHGRVLIEPRPVDIRRAIEEIADEFRGDAERKDIVLSTEYGDSLDFFTSDPRLFRLALGNLVSNAVKYTQSGHIRVQTRRIDRQLLFVVSDTGPGIPGEATARIFEPFEQLEDVSHKHIPGIGLGLALVREMADALGGRVEVQSQLGVGSTFTLVLPIDGPSLADASHVQTGNEPDR